MKPASILPAFLLILAGAAPSSPPPPDAPPKVRSIESLIERIPRDICPDRHGNWTELSLSVANAWLKKNVVGTEAELTGWYNTSDERKDGNGDTVSVVMLVDYARAHPVRGQDYPVIVAKGYAWVTDLICIFPASELPTLAKLHPQSNTRRGDSVTAAGTVSECKLQLLGDGLMIYVTLDSCHLVSK